MVELLAEPVVFKATLGVLFIFLGVLLRLRRVRNGPE